MHWLACSNDPFSIIGQQFFPHLHILIDTIICRKWRYKLTSMGMWKTTQQYWWMQMHIMEQNSRDLRVQERTRGPSILEFQMCARWLTIWTIHIWPWRYVSMFWVSISFIPRCPFLATPSASTTQVKSPIEYLALIHKQECWSNFIIWCAYGQKRSRYFVTVRYDTWVEKKIWCRWWCATELCWAIICTSNNLYIFAGQKDKATNCYDKEYWDSEYPQNGV